MLDPLDLYIRQVRLKDNPQGLEDYVADLPLIQRLDALKLERPVTFLVGENGSGNPPCWKPSRWPPVSTPKAAAGISAFPLKTPILSSIET